MTTTRLYLPSEEAFDDLVDVLCQLLTEQPEMLTDSSNSGVSSASETTCFSDRTE